jgi:hypothetical protein
VDDVLTDPVCYECGGPLNIVERNASMLTAVCADCGINLEIEVSPAPDGTPVHWPSYRISLKGE